MSKLAIWLLAIAIAPALLFAEARSASADGGNIKVISTSVTSEFPLGMRFKLEAEGDNEIVEVAIRFRIGQQARGEYNYLEFESGKLIDSELLFRTNTGQRYVPPGAIINYNFEILDSEGNELATERRMFIYHDARFEWEEVSEGPVTVAYHGPVKSRAELVLEAAIETINTMGPLLGADTEEPIRLTIYNNVAEMLDALPPNSATIRRELITEGQAFVDVGVVLVLAGGRRIRGTTSHELTHVITHRAGDSIFRKVPSWLNEGLSELGNVEPGTSYDNALLFALRNDRLLPITSLTSLPGTPDDVIIFYGQARDIVRFMVEEFGADSMKQLMAVMKSGTNVEDSIEEVYGVTRIELENMWRDTLGAPSVSAPDLSMALPTSLPAPVLVPYSLDSVQVSGPTPEPQAEPIEVPTSEPTSTPAPVAAVVQEKPTAEPAVSEQSDDGAGDAELPQGGACGVPAQGGPIAVELSFVAGIVGLAGLRFRRRKED
ncbi:MAG: hypothetical protein IH861_03400 [Chloroflexi bacterium]|nr:hypothetical protein [Chloroflexota bacterium]